MKNFFILFILILLSSSFSVYARAPVKFSECVDGDTFKAIVDGRQRTVRMLAIDTPESVHPTKNIEYYGKEASDFVCNVIRNSSNISLEFDINSDEFDKYDRLLAWVYVDDVLLQEILVSNGYAKVTYLYDDYKYTKILQEKEIIAKDKGIGIWNVEAEKNFNNSYLSIVEIMIIVIVLILGIILKPIINEYKRIKRKISDCVK